MDTVESPEPAPALAAEAAPIRLAELRQQHGLTQRGLAAHIGVSGPRVSAIENGDVDRTELATLRGYVAALGGRLRVVAEFDDAVYRVA